MKGKPSFINVPRVCRTRQHINTSNKYCKLAKNEIFPLTQTFLRHPSHLQPCSSPRLTQPRQRRRQEGGPAQPRAETRETRSPEMPRTQEPARQSVEMLKKGRGLREWGNPANQSQAQDARTQVLQLGFKVLQNFYSIYSIHSMKNNQRQSGVTWLDVKQSYCCISSSVLE